MRIVGSWLRAAGELVLPRECGGCLRPGTWWCEHCAAVLDRDPHRFDLDVGGGEIRCFSVAPYRGVAGAALVAMKERGVGALVEPLAAALERSVVAAAESGGTDGGHGVVLVPAPSRPSAVRARGADVVAELARACAGRLDRAGLVRPRAVRCLVHARAVADQASLDAHGRVVNLAGALRVRPVAAPFLAGRHVIVVDDVLTSGATLREAVRAIGAATEAAPPARIGCATVAAAGPFGAAFALQSRRPLVMRDADG